MDASMMFNNVKFKIEITIVIRATGTKRYRKNTHICLTDCVMCFILQLFFRGSFLLKRYYELNLMIDIQILGWIKIMYLQSR